MLKLFWESVITDTPEWNSNEMAVEEQHNSHEASVKQLAMLVPQQRIRKDARTSYIHLRLYKNSKTPSFHP
jgi:hypothetical protein